MSEDIDTAIDKVHADPECAYEAIHILRRQKGEAERLLRAVLLFYQAPEWDDAQRLEWEDITGESEATTKVLCDSIRTLLGIE